MRQEYGIYTGLRQLIGTRPIIGIGATVIIYNSLGQILLNHRTDTNTWGIPGGSMEPGEQIEEAAKRELYEETGLGVERLKLLNLLSGPEYFFVYPNGGQMHCVIVLFEAIGVIGELSINDDESTELKYFDFNNLPELESRADCVIKWILKKETC